MGGELASQTLAMIYFFLGTIFGSFFNVVGLRIPLGHSIVKPRSHCPTCQQTLTATQLIPIFSYFLQKGKCKYCYTKVSPLYPIIEALTGLLFMFSPTSLVAYLLISLLMIVVVSDITYLLIPNKILFFFAVLFLLLRFDLLGGFFGFGLLYLIAWLSKGGMGGGDVKLFGVIGLALGIKFTLLSFFFSIFSGTIVSVLLLFTGKINRKQPIPFAPFIAFGTLFAYFFGEFIIKLYLRWLG